MTKILNGLINGLENTPFYVHEFYSITVTDLEILTGLKNFFFKSSPAIARISKPQQQVSHIVDKVLILDI